MLLIIAYIMNNERLNLGNIKSVDKKMDYFILSNSADSGIIVDIINIMKNRKVNRFCVHLTEYVAGSIVTYGFSYFIFNAYKDKMGMGINEITILAGITRLSADILITAPVVHFIGNILGDKGSLLKSMIFTGIGSIISSGTLFLFTVGMDQELIVTPDPIITLPSFFAVIGN
uniref:Uncharacterized protein n=1 Tax=candidate division WOR-3 bacterium TaxID=2052148 RepID=A0A7C4YH79_UNCW3